MQLEDFYDYKNQLMEDLLTNASIVSLVNPDVKLKDAGSLAYTQVFPLDYIPETVQQGKTFVCFDVDVQSSANKTFLSPVLYVWVFSHSSKMRLPEGGVLVDKLCSEISKAINGSRYYGLGELNLYSVNRYAPMPDYPGKVMTFFMKEVNRFHDESKPTPVNRKKV